MKVKELSFNLARLNPLFDSTKVEEDGKLYREVFIEVRSGVKVLARIDETKENTYSTKYNGFKGLGSGCQKELVGVLEEYSKTPLDVRLTKK